MRKTVLVRTGELEKIFQAEVYNITTSPGCQCIIQSAEGLEFGEVLSEPELILEEEVTKSLRTIVRKATPQDIKQHDENKKRELEAYRFCQEQISAKNLKMKLVSASITFDRGKLTFYFTAEERVNFRELVKNMAKHFRARIDIHQIGVRDEAKVLGGIGCCGRPLCCATFLKSFNPVTIRMARNQNLSLNPEQISGVCGRLMCCLTYEHDCYMQIRKNMPKEGAQITTDKGPGRVVEIDVLKRTVKVELPTGEETEIPADNLVKPKWGKHRAKKPDK